MRNRVPTLPRYAAESNTTGASSLRPSERLSASSASGAARNTGPSAPPSSSPWMLPRYSYAWALLRMPSKAALRMISEEDYLGARWDCPGRSNS